MNEIRALLLAAGLGTRLMPLTERWPKCLMPIGERPLLEYWLETLYTTNVHKAIVNLHHHLDIVNDFLNRPRFKGWVHPVYEETLLGTAGTLRENMDFFHNCTTLFVHADNWCQCDFASFLSSHQEHRPEHCLITMMTFESSTPETCGIVETNEEGVVTAFHEKLAKPPGTLANGAVYILESEVIEWIYNHKNIRDFSTEVLPNFMGRIYTWKNEGFHKDIGQIQMLLKAQKDPQPVTCWPQIDTWQKKFLNHQIHSHIKQAVV